MLKFIKFSQLSNKAWVALLVGGAISGALALAYQDRSQIVGFPTELQTARDCVQTTASAKLGNRARAFVDFFEEAYLARLQAGLEWKGITGPVVYAGLRSVESETGHALTFEGYELAMGLQTSSPKLLRCASHLAVRVGQWYRMTEDAKAGGLPHKYRSFVHGQAYLSPLPAYIAK